MADSSENGFTWRESLLSWLVPEISEKDKIWPRTALEAWAIMELKDCINGRQRLSALLDLSNLEPSLRI